MIIKTENPQVYPLKEPLTNDELGITLRDHFAGLAMSNLVEWASAKELSKKAYKIADSMLEARITDK